MNKLSLVPLTLVLLLLVTACQTATEPVAEVSETVPATLPITLPETDDYTPVPYANAPLFLDNILSGGVPPDGIPAIEVPKFITMVEAIQLYKDDDQMFVTTLDGQIYLYPQKILVWHEIVNMTELGVSVTYCPLTGSCITFKQPDHLQTTFGTSGSLLNSNLVMYDRATGTNISQIDGVGLDNDLEGYILDTIPTYWIDFATARESFEDALVLSDITGFLRNYTRDPYGSYTEDGASNYYTSSGVMFPLINSDETYDFHDKQMVIGIKYKESKAAVIKSKVSKDEALNFTLSDTPMTAVYDPRLNNIRVFIGTYTLTEPDILVDVAGNQWAINGTAIQANAPLESPNHFEVMWFAWYAFYPDTEVIE